MNPFFRESDLDILVIFLLSRIHNLANHSLQGLAENAIINTVSNPKHTNILSVQKVTVVKCEIFSIIDLIGLSDSLLEILTSSLFLPIELSGVSTTTFLESTVLALVLTI